MELEKSPSRPASMHDVARVAGVHQTTVSRALRNSHLIPAATRQRIQAIAEKLGYRPHPLVSALIAIRRSRQAAPFQASIAFIMRPQRQELFRLSHLPGAQAAAEKLGYRVEPFVLEASASAERRLGAVLAARNIRGIIIAPLPKAADRFELEWSRFCTVAIEYTFTTPAFDRVVHDSYTSLRYILQQCRQRGLRRPGLMLTTTGHQRTQGLNGAAYWLEQKESPGLAAVSPLFLPAWDARAFETWHRRWRPDTIITSNDLLTELLAWCAQKGLRPGHELQIVNVNTTPSSRVSGMFQDPLAIGATAARMVVEKMTNNNFGVPLSGTPC